MSSEKVISDADRGILLSNISRSSLAMSLIEKACIAGFYAMRLYSPRVDIDEYTEICRDRVASTIVDSLEEAMKRYIERLEQIKQKLLGAGGHSG